MVNHCIEKKKMSQNKINNPKWKNNTPHEEYILLPWRKNEVKSKKEKTEEMEKCE